jgi:hypothetical protein
MKGAGETTSMAFFQVSSMPAIACIMVFTKVGIKCTTVFFIMRQQSMFMDLGFVLMPYMHRQPGNGKQYQ